jgi:hypothetical protein
VSQVNKLTGIGGALILTVAFWVSIMVLAARAFI